MSPVPPKEEDHQHEGTRWASTGQNSGTRYGSTPPSRASEVAQVPETAGPSVISLDSLSLSVSLVEQTKGLFFLRGDSLITAKAPEL